MTMTDIIIRNVSPDLHAALRMRAAEADTSMAAVILSILTDVLDGDSDRITVGFVQITRPGELDETYHCADCGAAGPGPLYLPVVGVDNPRFAAPVCVHCATCE